MRFFDRTEEIASLRKIREMAQDNAQFTVVTGRRRIGKTSLVWKAYEDEPILYFFVARKAEGDLCEDYRLEIENKLGVPTMGRAEHFTDVFEFPDETFGGTSHHALYRRVPGVFPCEQIGVQRYAAHLGPIQPEVPHQPRLSVVRFIP